MTFDRTIRDVFTGKAQVKEALSQSQLQDIYTSALVDGRILQGFPMSPVMFYGLGYASEMDGLFDRASEKFPGMTRDGRGMQDFFECTKSNPAMVHDADSGQVLLVFQTAGGGFTAAVMPEAEVARTIERDIRTNAGYLAMFRALPDYPCEGTTRDLSLMKRRCLDKTVRVFESETGLSLRDGIRDDFAAMMKAEDKNVEFSMNKNAIYDLIAAVSDDSGGAQTDQTRFGGNHTAAIAGQSLNDRIAHWIWRN